MCVCACVCACVPACCDSLLLLQANHTVDCSSATVEELLPENSVAGLNVSRTLLSAAAADSAQLVPSPSAGFTLFVTADTGFAKPAAGKGCTAAVAGQSTACDGCVCPGTGARLEAVKTLLSATQPQLASWTLYSFSPVQLLLAVGTPDGPFGTELQASTGNSTYSMTWNGSALQGEVGARNTAVWRQSCACSLLRQKLLTVLLGQDATVAVRLTDRHVCADVLSAAPGVVPLSVLASYNVCTSVVYVVGDVQWPTANASVLPPISVTSAARSIWCACRTICTRVRGCFAVQGLVTVLAARSVQVAGL